MSDRGRRILTCLALAIFVVVCIIDPGKRIENPTERTLVRSTILRAAATLVIIGCVWILRLRLLSNSKICNLALFLPAMAVALNNFPWIPLVTKTATFGRTDLWGVLLLHVLFVGLLEELAFRGILLQLLLRRFGKTKKGIWQSVILSSVLFGLLHLTNLMEGADVLSTFMQVGYSMLTGTLCAVLFIGTGNIIYCIIFHSVFNLGGMVSTFLLEGRIWTVPNILCTVFVSIMIGGWYLLIFCRIEPDLPYVKVFHDDKTKENALNEREYAGNRLQGSEQKDNPHRHRRCGSNREMGNLSSKKNDFPVSEAKKRKERSERQKGS